MKGFFWGEPNRMERRSNAGACDQIVQGTNDDATASKLHAVKRGYWIDPYIRYFCFSSTPKSPEINRGYFVRTQAFKALNFSNSFPKHNHGECQIVNLGAGSDTLFFILRDANLLPRKFIEIDLGYNVMRKITIIKNRKLFTESEIASGQLLADDFFSDYIPLLFRNRRLLHCLKLIYKLGIIGSQKNKVMDIHRCIMFLCDGTIAGSQLVQYGRKIQLGYTPIDQIK
ncbi:unnamed protein product [Echinostoma caproni]|uniref:[phosphatase 2A protein]-leucine-carboxy methyltransferase n=1 Tax=Echinostoma caproni TaxID=27848 RepID=A0A183BEH1_9TREM|nr:unnamed protein product [Echinostoma caproni]